jgi:hypothetical protein
MATFTPASEDDRSDATAFAARVARWNSTEPVRLLAADGQVTLWASTPFDVLATRTVRGSLHSGTVTVRAADLLGGLAVSAAPVIDIGHDLGDVWRSRLPPADGWDPIDDVPVSVIQAIVRSGTEAVVLLDQQVGHASGRGRGVAVPDEVLDAASLTVTGAGRDVGVPLRVLFALSGMGFAADGPDEVVRVRATRTWLRLDARYGAVVRRLIATLPLSLV